MRPIARWTVGHVSNCGMDILMESTKVFEKIYPEFDLMVCYNNIDRSILPKFSSKVIVRQQHSNEINYPLTAFDDPLEGVAYRKGGMAGSGWKLVPPRLNIKTHELWIDNDIIVRNRMKDIDSWLKKTNCGIISEGLGRIFGVYESLIPKQLKICAGFFGLPPHFDFHATILKYCKCLNGKSLGHYDEQGLVAATITNMKNFIIVPQERLRIVENHHAFDNFADGIHFVGANRLDKHSGWETYKRLRMKII